MATFPALSGCAGPTQADSGIDATNLVDVSVERPRFDAADVPFDRCFPQYDCDGGLLYTNCGVEGSCVRIIYPDGFSTLGFC